MTIANDMLCKQCGSVLSAVTFTCVRGEYCKAPLMPPFSAQGRTEDSYDRERPCSYRDDAGRPIYHAGVRLPK